MRRTVARLDDGIGHATATLAGRLRSAIMVRQASSDSIPSHGAYVVGTPHAADDLSMPLRRAFGRDTRMPAEIEACMEKLRRVR